LPALDEASGLGDYLAYAALNNPGLEAAFNRWKAAVERVPQAEALPDPQLTYAYYIREVETRVGPQQQRIGLKQMFPWFGVRHLRGDAAMQTARAAEQRYRAAKLKLFRRVRDAYYEYNYLGRAIGIVREQRDLLRYMERVLRERYRVGDAQHADLVRAQVELGKLEDRLRALEDLRGPAAARLNAALNRPVAAPVPWPAGVPHRMLNAGDEEVLAWMEEGNPELEALRHEVMREDAGILLARKEYYPDVTLGLDYIDTDDALMPGTSDSSKDPVIAMLSLNLPIWRGKLDAGVREARARRRAAVAARSEQVNGLRAEVKMVLYKVRDAERRMLLYRNTLVPKARQSLKASQTAFQAGTATFLEVLDAVRALLEFELSYERALADHVQRLAELEMLVGRELPLSEEDPIRRRQAVEEGNEQHE
jgi:outer membrane protein TolC